MWKLETKTIPVVIRALGMIKIKILSIKSLGKPSLQEIQDIALTSTAHILWEVLSM